MFGIPIDTSSFTKVDFSGAEVAVPRRDGDGCSSAAGTRLFLSYGIFGVDLVHPNGKSLERAGSVTEDVVLCSGLVDGGRWSQDYCRRRIGSRCIILSQYPNSWAYSCNIYSHRQPYNQYS